MHPIEYEKMRFFLLTPIKYGSGATHDSAPNCTDCALKSSLVMRYDNKVTTIL